MAFNLNSVANKIVYRNQKNWIPSNIFPLLLQPWHEKAQEFQVFPRISRRYLKQQINTKDDKYVWCEERRQHND